MTDDELGLQRAEQVESALKRELTTRVEAHREWLSTQLASLNSEADQVQRELEEAAELRKQKHHQLKDINPERIRDADGIAQSRGQDAWVAVACFFGLTVFLLFVTMQQFAPHSDLVPFIALADFCLGLFGFLALTPLWSPGPKPPALMPERPVMPKVIEETLELGSGTWRNRLEDAQSKLTKLTGGDQTPESSAYLQQVLAQSRANLQRFIADGRAYLTNTEVDHLGWRGVAWPEWMQTLRFLGLAFVPGALAPLYAEFDTMGLLHGSIALAGGLAAGFFRRSSLSFVEPPETE